MSDLPEFLIIGAPKCGTASMMRYLADHSQIHFLVGEEPHFYTYTAEGRPHWGVGDIDEYSERFAEAGPEQLRGEKSSWYLYSETAAQQIEKYAPDTKCIALLRQPVDRAYSHWSFRVQNGWETLSFRDAIEAEEERIANGAFWGTHYMCAGRYHEQLRRFYDHLGPDQVRVLWFEELVRDSDAVVRDALSFLGLEPEATVDTSTVHNETRFPQFQWLNKLRHSNWVRRASRRLIPRFARPLVGNLYQWINGGDRPALGPEYRSKLTQRVWADVKRLQRLLDVDLSHWAESTQSPLSAHGDQE